MFLEGELAVLNHQAKTGLPHRIGEICTVETSLYDSQNYDYLVRFEDNETTKVKEHELLQLTDRKNELITYVKVGSHVEYMPTKEVVLILKTDFLHELAEVEFEDAGIQVVRMTALRKIDKEIDRVEEEHGVGKFTEIALEIGMFTDKKNKQYGSSVDATYEMIKVLMERYKNDDENYLIPKSLIKHILLQVRMMDKINRVFNNPSGEGDSESPYNDLAGYSLIGIDMVAK